LCSITIETNLVKDLADESVIEESILLARWLSKSLWQPASYTTAGQPTQTNSTCYFC